MRHKLFNRKNKETEKIVITEVEVCDSNGMFIEKIESTIEDIIDNSNDYTEEDREELKGLIKRILRIKYENKKSNKKYSIEKESNYYKTYEDLLISLGIAEKMENDPLYEMTEEELNNIENEFMKRTGKNLMDVFENIFED